MIYFIINPSLWFNSKKFEIKKSYHQTR